MDYRLNLMTGADIPIPECQLTLHQPSIKEIGLVGEEDFLSALQLLWINKNSYLEDNINLSDMTNFQIFMTIMQDKEAVNKKLAVLSVLQLLFPAYKIMFSPRAILFNCNLLKNPIFASFFLFSPFTFVTTAFGIISKKSLPNSVSWSFYFMFYSKSFKGLGL